MAEEIGGKVREEAGKLVGSKERQAKGVEKPVEGKVQQQVGDLKATVKGGSKPRGCRLDLARPPRSCH